MTMRNVKALEAARRGRKLAYWSAGEVYDAPDPREMDPELIMRTLAAERLPGSPDTLPVWKHRVLVGRWAAHYALPPLAHCQRLGYLVDTFGDELEVDLQVVAGVDLVELWQSRDWTKLLNLIDRLPRATWYNEAQANDEAHAARVAEHLANLPADEKASHPRPPLHVWDQQSAMMADMINSIRSVNYTLQAVNSDKGKAKPPEPYPVPETALDRMQKVAKNRVRKRKHDALAARMLPHKRP